MSEKIGKSIFRVNFTVENYFYSIHNANQHFSIWSIPIESILVFLHIVQKQAIKKIKNHTFSFSS